jgi:iron complex transport system ATP-binding protein
MGDAGSVDDGQVADLVFAAYLLNCATRFHGLRHTRRSGNRLIDQTGRLATANDVAMPIALRPTDGWLPPFLYDAGMSVAPPLFDLIDVGYSAGGTTVIDGASWRVALGQRWAVLGPNGAGKSTLVRLAIGQLWPTAGRIERQGKDRQDLRDLWRRIGLVTDLVAREIPADELVIDTVTSGCMAQLGLKFFVGMEPSDDDRGRAAAELARIGCGNLARRPFGVLSQGERQKVMVARAPVADPLLLVFDEPCDGMDPGARERFLDWLGDHLRAPGSPAVVLMTHHVEEIIPAFENTLVLREGRVLASGPTGDVLTREVFERLYDTKLDRLERAGGRSWPIWG